MAKGVRQVSFQLDVSPLVVPLDGLQAQIKELMDVVKLRLLEAAQPAAGYTLDVSEFKIGEERVDQHQLALMAQLSCPECGQQLPRLKGLLMLSLTGIRHPDRELERGVACAECGCGDVRVVLPAGEARAWVEDVLPARSGRTTLASGGPSKRASVIALAVLAALLLGLGYAGYRLYTWLSEPSPAAARAELASEEEPPPQATKARPSRADPGKQVNAVKAQQPLDAKQHHGLIWAARSAVLRIQRKNDHKVSVPEVSLRSTIGGWRPSSMQKMSSYFWKSMDHDLVQAVALLKAAGAPAARPRPGGLAGVSPQPARASSRTPGWPAVSTVARKVNRAAVWR